jgi:monofunctional biosynthetic peptidoglycan transglycosylase
MARPAPKRRWLRIIGRVIEYGIVAVAFGLLLLWCSVPSTDALATENPTTTAFIDLRREQGGKAFKLEWKWRPIGKISRYLRAAIIYAEDYNFYRHDGVDWSAIESAVESNLDKGTLSIGGSTITQQLAKNLYLSPSRSFLRKLRELLIAYSLEDSLSKQRILEIYLNVVEWGEGVFGAEAAARHWLASAGAAPAAVRLAIAAEWVQAAEHQVARFPRSPCASRLLRLCLIDDRARDADAVGAPEVATLPSKKPPIRGATAPPTPASAGAPHRRGRGRSEQRRIAVAVETADCRSERIWLVDKRPVARRLDADPAHAVPGEQRAAALAAAVRHARDEQHRHAERGEPADESFRLGQCDQLGRAAVKARIRHPHRDVSHATPPAMPRL